MKYNYIVAISGASGTIYGLKTVEYLSQYGDVEVIVSNDAIKVSEYECLSKESLIQILKKYSKSIYSADEIEAPPSSTSYLAKVKGVVISPCSLRTLASIAHGLADNLITRTAVNALRLRKRLVLVIRETPLGVAEIKNMLSVAEYGGVILPASPGFYNNPQSLLDVINFIVGKTLDALEIDHNLYRRWKPSPDKGSSRNLCHHIYGL